MVVFVGFFFVGEEAFTLGFFFLEAVTGVAIASLSAAPTESSALADSSGASSPVPVILVSMVLVSAPLSACSAASPFLAFFFEILIRFGLGGLA